MLKSVIAKITVSHSTTIIITILVSGHLGLSPSQSFDPVFPLFTLYFASYQPLFDLPIHFIIHLLF